MKLAIKERLGLLGLLPKEGNVLTLKIIRDLQQELGFSEEEIKKHKIIQLDSNRVSWEPEKAGKEKDIEIGEKANDVVVLALSKLNKDEKLSLDMLPLYERFIPEK